MKQLHESGLFFYKASNGLLTARMPAGVKAYKVFKENGTEIEVFGKKVFYFRDFDVLEVIMDNGEKRYFKYRALWGKFLEIDEEEV